MKIARSERLTFVVLAAALVLTRLTLLAYGLRDPSQAILEDSYEYLDLAGNLRQSGQFMRSDGEPTNRTPVYPVFLAALQSVFGSEPAVVIIAQSGVSIATGFLAYLAGRSIAGAKAGLWALGLYAVNPNALFWSYPVLTETLFAFWIILSVALLAAGVQSGRNILYAASGLALAVGVLTRPIGVYLVPIWVVSVVAMQWVARRPKFRWGQAVGFLLAASIPVLAWQLRNQIVQGEFRLTGSDETVFVDWIAAYTLGDAEGIPRSQADILLRQSADPRAAALDAIRKYPGSFIRVTLRGISTTLMGTQAPTWATFLTGESYSGSGFLGSVLRGDLDAAVEGVRRILRDNEALPMILLVWGLGYSALVYAASAYGLWTLRDVRGIEPRYLIALVTLTAVYLLIVPLANGDARFRVPVEPLLCLLGGLGLSHKFATRSENE